MVRAVETGNRALAIPGSVHWPPTARGRVERPDGAPTPEQTADFLFDRLAQGGLYILCPDKQVDHRTDETRSLWAADDIDPNRPPLSPWHLDHAEPFKRWLKE